jgi:hypothetical protein
MEPKMYNHWAGVQGRTHAVALACQCHKFSPGEWSHELTLIVGLNVFCTADVFQFFQKNLIDFLLEQQWDTGITANKPLPPN